MYKARRICFASIFFVLSLLFCFAFSNNKMASAEDTIWNGTLGTTANNSASFSGGVGSENDPYIINTAADLSQIASNVNAGYTYYQTAYYKQTSSIHLNDVSQYNYWHSTSPSNFWVPIGNSTSQFSGYYDGNNYEIEGMFIKNSMSYQALFGASSENASIVNVRIVKGMVICGSDTSCIASIVGENKGIIENCFSSAYVEGGGGVGTISGRNWGSIINSETSGSVYGKMALGGISGNNLMGTIMNCFNSGVYVLSNTSGLVGGITGYNTGSVKNCYNDTHVQSQGASTGAIVGSNTEGTVENCFYKNGCAEDGSGTAQYGIGASLSNTTPDIFGSTTPFNTMYTLLSSTTIGDYSGTSLVEALNAFINEYYFYGVKSWNAASGKPYFDRTIERIQIFIIDGDEQTLGYIDYGVTSLIYSTPLGNTGVSLSSNAKYYTEESGGEIVIDNGIVQANIEGYTNSSAMWIMEWGSKIYKEKASAIEILETNGYSCEYDGEEHSISISVSLNAGAEITGYKWYKKGEEEDTEIYSESYSFLMIKNSDDTGTYYCVINVSFNSSTEEIVSDDIEVVIGKRQLYVTNSMVSNKIYDGYTYADCTLGVVQRIIEGEDVSVFIESANFRDAELGYDKPVDVIYSIYGMDEGNYLAPESEVIYADITETEEVPEIPFLEIFKNIILQIKTFILNIILNLIKG
ncbi:MAG: hypothetical protein H6687_00730 [Bacillales bacterium]|nr:hypothetical protein [Bacillales bacterium]